MPPVPSKPAPPAATPTHSLRFGLGFQLTLGTHTVKVEPEPTELDALREGTFKYALPDGTDLDVGSLADAWKDLRDFAPALPELPEMTGALNDVENVAITVRDLKIGFVKWKLDQLLLNVALETNWKVSALEGVKVDRLMFLIDYQATS